MALDDLHKSTDMREQDAIIPIVKTVVVVGVSSSGEESSLFLKEKINALINEIGKVDFNNEDVLMITDF